MTFKRIDEETVCCIVTEDDMIDNGLQIEDFLENKEKVQDFLHSIVEQAEEEVGYEMKNGILSMQVAMLPEHKLAITFSEKENIGIRDMMEQMKKAMSAFEEEPLSGGDIVRGLEKEIQKEKAAERKKKRSDSNTDSSTEEMGQRCAVMAFDSLHAVVQAGQLLSAETVPQEIQNSCYRFNDKYYLLLENVEVKQSPFLKLCGLAMEYGRIEESTEERIAYIKEHGNCILKKNALLHLSRL